MKPLFGCNKTYGVSELTGKKIDAERLEALPWTRFSAEAERQLEKEGDIRSAHLGERSSVAKVKPFETEEEDREG